MITEIPRYISAAAILALNGKAMAALAAVTASRIRMILL